MQKYCTKCGSLLNKGDGLCPKCATLSKKFCKRCGNLLDIDGRCNNCDVIQDINSSDNKRKNKKNTIKTKDGLKQKKNKKIYLIWLAILCLILLIMAFILHFYYKYEASLKNDINSQKQVEFISGTYTDIKITDKVTALEAGEDALIQLNLDNANIELNCNESTNINGLCFYRLQQMYKGIPVYGHSMVITTDELGKPMGFSSNLSDFRIETSSSSVTNEQLTASVKEKFGDQYSLKDISDADMVFYENEDGSCRMAYDLCLYKDNIAVKQVFLDANSADVLGLFNIESEIVKIGYNSDKSKQFDVSFENAQYTLEDETRNIYIWNMQGSNSDNGYESAIKITSENDIFGDSQGELDADCDDAITLYQNIIKIYDFYQDTYRIGIPAIFNAGLVGVYNDSHSQGRSASYCPYYDQGCSILSMGEKTGVANINILAHEYAHMISSNIVGWKTDSTALHENDAINEAFSDIMGIICEFSITGNTTWEIKGDSFYRNIEAPEKSMNPDNTTMGLMEELETAFQTLKTGGVDGHYFLTSQVNYTNQKYF